MDFARLANPGIRGLDPYDPGHDLVALRRKLAPRVAIELGANENNHGASPRARQAVRDALDTLHVYPDPRGGQLKQALARHHGVDPDGILLGNGSHELLMQVAQVFAGPDAGVLASEKSFAVFALAARAAAAPLALAPAFPALAPMPHGHDLRALAAAIDGCTRLVYLANPNNPTGTWYCAADFADFMRRIPPHVLVLVDEAYAEFVDAPDWASAIPLLDEFPNLLVTRTFSKAHGLAGLRVGCLLAHRECIAVMERVRESFNVNALGLAAAEAALGDAGHLRRCVDENNRQREALTVALRERGVGVAPSQTNFVLADVGADCARIEARLLAQGVVLRPMVGYGLPRCLRMTVGTAEQNAALLAALDRVLT